MHHILTELQCNNSAVFVVIIIIIIINTLQNAQITENCHKARVVTVTP